MAKYPQDYLEKTIHLFQSNGEAPLTVEDAQEIADNVLNLYEYLLERKNNASLEKEP